MFDPSSRTQSVHYGASCGEDASELSSILELVTDAWNYFPYKVLGDISPTEKLLEYKNKGSSGQSPEVLVELASLAQSRGKPRGIYPY